MKNNAPNRDALVIAILTAIIAFSVFVVRELDQINNQLASSRVYIIRIERLEKVADDFESRLRKLEQR